MLEAAFELLRELQPWVLECSDARSKLKHHKVTNLLEFSQYLRSQGFQHSMRALPIALGGFDL